MHCVLVSHTHWDREWYRTFQGFRARLVDAVDQVLERIAEDPGFRFLLDGQTIILEDYLEIRPERRDELERACRSGRVAIGPWYVQPDSLLPCGEALVRNLLEGRRVGSAFGEVSRVAYTPDSFGHPAQLPQIFAGFGLGPFIYWRGNGNEIDSLPAEYLWEAPDGSAVLAHHLSEGYFAAAGIPEDPIWAAHFLERLASKLAERTRGDRVLLMNGIDHALPEARSALAVEALARVTGWTVERGLLEDFAAGLSQDGDTPRFRGELTGGRIANLLPGVWSTRVSQKLRNRHAEAALLGWSEPWSALARTFGAPDERASLRTAWRSLLRNQAHDSICGCSQDRVHEQMEARYDEASELAEETAKRVLERLAGLGSTRRRPWAADFDVAVFNPSPHARTDVVSFALEGDPWVEFRGELDRSMQVHPLLGGTVVARGYTANGEPARLVRDASSPRLRLDPARPPLCVEVVVKDVPAFGWRRVRLARSEEHPDVEDDGREIKIGSLAVRAADDGTLAVSFGERTFEGLFALEDEGDRGDTYDFDPVAGTLLDLESVRVRRSLDANGVAHLFVERVVSLPAGLSSDRAQRSDERATLRLDLEARLIPGVARVDVDVRLHDAAHDHRLRLLFPTGEPSDTFHAATTFDVARRTAGARSSEGWVHPAPATFPQHGLVSAGGLTVGAPGLPEAEVTREGVIAITLVRAVGWLALMDLKSRPIPAGPVIATPGAQCDEPIEARFTLLAGLDPRGVRDAELGLGAVVAGDAPLLAEDRGLLEIEPREILLEALKPAEDGEGMVLRLLNPTDEEREAIVRPGFSFASALAVRLDESPLDETVSRDGDTLRVIVPPHGLRSLLIR